MKRLFRIFKLSKNEQRVVLVAMLILIAIAFGAYERRIHRAPAKLISATEAKPSPTVAEIEEDR